MGPMGRITRRCDSYLLLKTQAKCRKEHWKQEDSNFNASRNITENRNTIGKMNTIGNMNRIAIGNSFENKNSIENRNIIGNWNSIVNITLKGIEALGKGTLSGEEKYGERE
jgi:hypothetical protein